MLFVQYTSKHKASPCVNLHLCWDDRDWVHVARYFPGNWRLWSIYLVQRLRVSGTIPPMPYITSWRVQTKLNSAIILFLYTVKLCADKTKYMVMSWDQNAGRSHSMKSDNSSFERVEEFKYLGTTLTNQNSIQEEIKSRLKSGNACYLPVFYPKI